MADSDPVTKKDLEELKDTLTELTRDVETSMLTAFHGYAKGQAVRLQAVEIADAAVNQRLDALELRVLNLETRRPH
jgi:hypothetical protein